ncbi:MAG: hypothetical protein COA97_04245 [Flavobacteriales bacterium]|nr:MAG: hypothetical protein COA97_04245 [Flavobacteriales bacterium]
MNSFVLEQLLLIKKFFKLINMKSTRLSKTLIILGLGVVTVLSGCQSTTPFTNTVRTQYNLDEAKLKKMQFYISTDITLQRGERGVKTQELDEDGKLIVSSSASLDNILVDAKTPGVCVKVLSGNKLAISFFETDDQYLVFGDPNNRGRYNLMGAEWKAGKGKINFGGKTYYILPGGAGAYLKFELKKVKDYKTTTKKAKGRTIN